MNSSRGFRGVLTVAVLLVLTPASAWSADEQKAKEAEIDAKVREIVGSMVDHLQNVDSVQTTMTTTMTIEGGGFSDEQTATYSVRFKRPDQFAMEFERGQAGATIISDGEQVYTYVPMLRKYTVGEAPENVDALMQGGMGGMGFVGISAFFAPSENAEKKIFDGVKTADYVGTEELHGVECHRLELTQDQIDWELWVRTGDKPLAQRIAFDMAKFFQSQQAAGGPFAEQFKDAKMEMSITFDDWNLDADLAQADFRFTPPQGAEEVESFTEGLSDSGPDSQSESHSLVGQKAPPFTLSNLEGESIDLAQHLGEDIVILDFWATWCGPCVRAMPTLLKVAEQYKDKGVVFYAVNIREKEGAVSKFLEANELDVPVLLDTEGAVSQKYEANAIPQTVLIGQQGRVQVVHVGLLPDLEERLTEELDALREGKNLAQQKRE